MLALAEPQALAVAHDEGPLLVVGAAGTGKTEVLARRLARLAAEGTGPERVLVLASTRATARRLRERAEVLLEGPYEELWIGTWESCCERLLRAHATAAGLDPFFDILGPAERLAILLDRIDDLPLRGHEIRGNPAGLLARLLERVDILKAGADPPDPELAEFCAAHDRILASTGNLDEGDLYLTLNKLLHEQPQVKRQITTSFRYLMVDEYEDATPAQKAILSSLFAENPNQLYALDDAAGPSSATSAGGMGGGGARTEAKPPPAAPLPP